MPTWHFSCAAWLCPASCNKERTVHVEPVRQWVPWAQLSMSQHVRIGTGLGRGRRGERGRRDMATCPEVHRMDMGTLGAAHGHLGTPSSPRRLPLGVFLPSLPCSRDSHALRRFQPALRPCAATQCGLPHTALACACHVAHVLPLHVHNVLPCSC